MLTLPLLMHCPVCRKQHVDEGIWETKPHHTHRCVDDACGKGCGHEWEVSGYVRGVLVPPKRVIGLTGGIASGKSTVGKLFTGFGVTVIDADLLAREVVAPGTEGLRKVAAHFGAKVLAEDGTLDRRALGAVIFTDGGARQELDAILHPLIASLSAERIQAAQASPTPYVVYEAALLVELGLYKEHSKLVVVSADPELQVRRVMKRNALTESEARDRLASQFPLAKKLAVADYVIENDNDRDALLERTREVHEKLLDL